MKVIRPGPLKATIQRAQQSGVMGGADHWPAPAWSPSGVFGQGDLARFRESVQEREFDGLLREMRTEIG